MVNATILPLLFISDVFIPLTDAPAWLETVAKVFPIWHYAHAMLAVFDPFEPAFYEQGNLLVVAAWGVGATLVAARFFSWEPRK